MISQAIIDLVVICHKKGIENVILSPGSRCAPLTLAFARHPDIHTRIISDERSAAFIALGMAQQLEKPVALVCTSGSAAMNYYPAIAEAFFQEVPLLVLTADRPPEWIDQFDGQTVFQKGIYGKHVKESFQFPDSFSSEDSVWYANRMVNEAINLSIEFPKGPVHINIPLREPFYPAENEEINFPTQPKVFNQTFSYRHLTHDEYDKIKSQLKQYSRILILPGQQGPNPIIQSLLDQLVENQNVVVVSDTISNLQSDSTINLHDHWIGNTLLNNELAPDLILSFGKSIISKPLKLYLRSLEADHWHIQAEGTSRDTFKHLSKVITTEPHIFLKWLNEHLDPLKEEFIKSWKKLENLTQNLLPEIIRSEAFGEYQALESVLKIIPHSSKLHLANSMTVRYVNYFGKQSQEIICNRGTSGIDGSNSTAVGCTFTTKEPVTLITGDMAFFYDRNAFWHNYTMPNLRIILLNNHAGGIFRLIDGPSDQPELEEYFETKQLLSATNISQEFDFEYQKAETSEELETALKDFYSPSTKPKLIEVQTSSQINAEILKKVKGKIKTLLSEGLNA